MASRSISDLPVVGLTAPCPSLPLLLLQQTRRLSTKGQISQSEITESKGADGNPRWSALGATGAAWMALMVGALLSSPSISSMGSTGPVDEGESDGSIADQRDRQLRLTIKDRRRREEIEESSEGEFLDAHDGRRRAAGR